MIIHIIAACIVLLYAFVLLIFTVTFGKRYEEDKNLYYKTSDDYPDLQREDISFPSGNNTLHGSLYKTNDNCKDLVIFCHGLGAGHHSYLTEIHAIAQAGHLVFSYDNTGCVASEGKKIRSFYQAVKDVNSAIDYAMSRDDLKHLPIKTAGHSWGGYTAIHALENKHVQKAAVFAPLNDPAKTFAIQVAEVTKIPAALLEPFIRLQLRILDGKNGLCSSADILAATTKEVYVVQGLQDSMVTLDYNVLKDTRLSGKSNLTMVPKEGSKHNPYLTLQAEKYMTDVFANIEKLKKEKKENELKQAYSEIDYALITEEDPKIMEGYLNFLK